MGLDALESSSRDVVLFWYQTLFKLLESFQTNRFFLRTLMSWDMFVKFLSRFIQQRNTRDICVGLGVFGKNLHSKNLRTKTNNNPVLHVDIYIYVQK